MNTKIENLGIGEEGEEPIRAPRPVHPDKIPAEPVPQPAQPAPQPEPQQAPA